MSRIVLLTTEPLPLDGWPTTGAGLRAWGLAQGLRGRGHEVLAMMPEDAAAGFCRQAGVTQDALGDLPDWVETFKRNELEGDERLAACDVIVLQHWGMARDLGEIEVPLAIDLAGPHLLERALWGSTQREGDLLEKLEALRRADFLTASGHWQRLYFLPYLAMAGWRIEREAWGEADPLPVIPYSLKVSPTIPESNSKRFFYGGFFLPWQDPAAPIEALLDAMDEVGEGELVFIGGEHPHAGVSGGKFDALLERLDSNPRVRRLDSMSYDAYLDVLKEGGVALDLMRKNAERELAFTTRTVQYMACGLPVIHDRYSELGEMIEAAGAGWAMDPNDRDRLMKLFMSILRGEFDLEELKQGGLELIRTKLDWDTTIEPLDRFCSEPKFRAGKLSDQLKYEQREHLLRRTESKLAAVQSDLDTIKGKRWIRWGLYILSGRGATAGPAALALGIVGLILYPVIWISDRLGR